MEKSVILHKHHIVPRHMGGTDEPHNISYPISLEDHAIWHRVLARMFPEYSHGNHRAANFLDGGPSDGFKGENNYWFGRKNPRFAEMARERTTGSKWYHKGDKELQYKPGQQPEGWELGRPSYRGKKNHFADPENRYKLTREECQRGARVAFSKRIQCDCGCNRTWDPGNYAQHKKRMEKKNGTTN